jgi:hypothetical protein
MRTKSLACPQNMNDIMQIIERVVVKQKIDGRNFVLMQPAVNNKDGRVAAQTD